jgi:hypothetical protein
MACWFLWQGDIPAHILHIGAVVLPHDEELAVSRTQLIGFGSA